jgi:hypothetical protein
MVSNWYTKKNSITDWILYGVAFNPALTLCHKSEFELRREGDCIQIRKVVKEAIKKIMQYIDVMH